jgi:hypothetical protein
MKWDFIDYTVFEIKFSSGGRHRKPSPLQIRFCHIHRNWKIENQIALCYYLLNAENPCGGVFSDHDSLILHSIMKTFL